MLIVAIIFSFSITSDKVAVQNSDPLFASSITLLSLGVIFYLIFMISGSHQQEKRGSSLLFLLVGLSTALSAVSICYAYTRAIVAYVIPIKRLSILFSVIYGGYIFHEPALGKRIFGAVFMALGAILISLSEYNHPM